MDRFEQIMAKLDKIEEMVGGLHKRKPPSPPVTEDFERYIQLYNTLFNAKARGDEKTKRQFSARTKDGYTLEEFRQAMLNAKKVQNHIESNFRYLTAEFFTRAEKLQMYGDRGGRPKQTHTGYTDLEKKD